MPSRLIHTAEHGLVVFCGAGVSMVPPSSLPSWWALNEQIVASLAALIERYCGAAQAQAGALLDIFQQQVQKAVTLAAQLKAVHPAKGVKRDGKGLVAVLVQPGVLFGAEGNARCLRRGYAGQQQSQQHQGQKACSHGMCENDQRRL